MAVGLTLNDISLLITFLLKIPVLRPFRNIGRTPVPDTVQMSCIPDEENAYSEIRMSQMMNNTCSLAVNRGQASEPQRYQRTNLLRAGAASKTDNEYSRCAKGKSNEI